MVLSPLSVHVKSHVFDTEFNIDKRTGLLSFNKQSQNTPDAQKRSFILLLPLDWTTSTGF